jgi:N-succinyldiaminopimelate aminotransferase
MNKNLKKLKDYPFAKLNALLKTESTSSKTLINLSIGEPQHSAPSCALSSISEHIQLSGTYPKTKGLPEFSDAVTHWLQSRFFLKHINGSRHILPVNGTREALFSIAQTIINLELDNPLVISPNPFYQIYEGAAYLAGATPYFLPCSPSNGYIPDYSTVPENIWRDCQLMYICSPSNPSGVITPIETMKQLILLSHKYNFTLVSDECYSEIYTDKQPPSLLQACEELGETTYKNCLVFHSLSKRSNLPGLRSGFTAGDPNIINNFLKYRTYHGSAMSEIIQKASISAWKDEEHVQKNRALYLKKIDDVYQILSTVTNVNKPEAGFYIWLATPICDLQFSKMLYEEENVITLPGSFLSRNEDGINPGRNHIRIALVAEYSSCIDAALRLKSFMTRHQFC